MYFRRISGYFLVHLSSPASLPPLLGLALRSLLEGSHPPPPPCDFVGYSLLSSLWPALSEDTSSLDARRRCMKLQNPPRLHSPFSFWRQQASRKSVTGESSAYNGRPAESKHLDINDYSEIHTSIPAIIKVVHGCLSLIFPFKTCIHISDQMVANIVTHLRSKASIRQADGKEWITYVKLQ